MVARKKIENSKKIVFDIYEEINPRKGLGGLHFDMNLKDFEAIYCASAKISIKIKWILKDYN